MVESEQYFLVSQWRKRQTDVDRFLRWEEEKTSLVTFRDTERGDGDGGRKMMEWKERSEGVLKLP